MMRGWWKARASAPPIAFCVVVVIGFAAGVALSGCIPMDIIARNWWALIGGSMAVIFALVFRRR